MLKVNVLTELLDIRHFKYVYSHPPQQLYMGTVTTQKSTRSVNFLMGISWFTVTPWINPTRDNAYFYLSNERLYLPKTYIMFIQQYRTGQTDKSPGLPGNLNI